MRRLHYSIATWLVTVSLAVALFVLLQGRYRFLFLEMGDNVLFRWDASAWWETIAQPWGFLRWANDFIVQFFHVPVLGTALAAVLLSLTAGATYILLGNVIPLPLVPLTLIPTALLTVDVLTGSYSFQAVTDYLVVALLCALLLRRAMPSQWSKFRNIGMSTAVKVSVSAAILLAIVLPFAKILNQRTDLRKQQVFQLSYYARNGQWSYITAACRNMDMGNYMLLNYANLALSHQGKLLEHWTSYRQDDPQALCLKSDMTPGCMELLSMIHYNTGNIAAAQDMAFESNQYCERPETLKMLVRTNIIFGNYKVAGKYIARLEKTLFHRDWAKGMRKCLSDSAVASDPELSSKRRGLPRTDAFTLRDRLLDDLVLLLEADPSNKAARDYAIVNLNLGKDARALKAFVDKFYGTQVLPMLSNSMQIGLLTASQGDLEYCLSHGVSRTAIEVYENQKAREQ